MIDLTLEHPSREQLVAFGLGRVKEADANELDSHIERCDACRAVVHAAPDDTLAALVREVVTLADSPFSQGDPEIPTALASHPRYQVVEWLGSGGMGTVYKAVHRFMDRPVALKVIHPILLAGHTEAVERFRREVEAAAQLDHANIVKAYDAEQAGDLHFLAMEFVDGENLAQVVEKRGPLPIAEACDYIRQAALGLQHAFEHGMVHRDIKPQNLMLSPSGQIKILDFGLARLAREYETDPSVTSSGLILGTPDYIAPEQADDPHSADIRADIYCLGCTLYFLLAGRPPFPEGSTIRKLAMHLERSPTPLSELRADLPPELARAIERMMQKQPAERYQTPAEVADMLLSFLPVGSSLSGSTTISSLRRLFLGQGTLSRRTLFRLFATAAAAIAIVGTGLVLFFRPDNWLRSSGLTIHPQGTTRDHAFILDGDSTDAPANRTPAPVAPALILKDYESFEGDTIDPNRWTTEGAAAVKESWLRLPMHSNRVPTSATVRTPPDPMGQRLLGFRVSANRTAGIATGGRAYCYVGVTNGTDSLRLRWLNDVNEMIVEAAGRYGDGMLHRWDPDAPGPEHTPDGRFEIREIGSDVEILHNTDVVFMLKDKSIAPGSYFEAHAHGSEGKPGHNVLIDYDLWIDNVRFYVMQGSPND